jgi:hypothetical protein
MLWEVAPLPLTAAQRELSRDLYSKHLVSGSERSFYDALRNSASRCPYCLSGEIAQIDHFLPKDRFAEYAVHPDNLVPICHRCNHQKGNKSPIDAQSAFLHPYFDVLPATRWLVAALHAESGGPAIVFDVLLDEDQYGAVACRLKYQFGELKLSSRFGVIAATILAEMEDVLSQHLDGLNSAEVAEHFESEARRYFRVHGNCLEAAAYFAAASNVDYCAGAYRS